MFEVSLSSSLCFAVFAALLNTIKASFLNLPTDESRDVYRHI
jgi:hypothetical protein